MVQPKASTLENQMVGGRGWEKFLPSTEFRRQSFLWALEFGSEQLFCHLRICLFKDQSFEFFSKFAQYSLEDSIIFSIPGWKSMIQTWFPTTQKSIFWHSRESCFKKLKIGIDPQMSLDEVDTYTFSIIFTFVWLDSFTIRLLLSRSKLCVFHIRAVWIGGWGHTSHLNQWQKNPFLLSKGHFLTL